MDRMASLSPEHITTTLRGVSLRQNPSGQWRGAVSPIWSAHFLNHALGNISAEALASGVLLAHLVLAIAAGDGRFSTRPASCTPGLGIWAFYERRQIPLEGDGAAAARCSG